MTSTSEISVIIPACNAAATLSRAITSVLTQTSIPGEIVVVDDASSDATAVLARELGAKLISLPKASGAAAARNAGIRVAQGSWIAFLDADDEWLPRKLERQVAMMSHGHSLVFCASEEFSPDGSSLGDTFRGREVICDEAWKYLLQANYVATPTVLAPRHLLLELGGFDERLPVGEDQDMWIRLTLAGEAAYVPETLVRVHICPKSLSSFRPTDQSRFILPMIERHVATLKDRLSRAQIRAILGERLNNAGRIAFAHGDFLRGSAFLLRAVAMGYRPLAGMAVIAKAPFGAMRRRFIGPLAA